MQSSLVGIRRGTFGSPLPIIKSKMIKEFTLNEATIGKLRYILSNALIIKWGSRKVYDTEDRLAVDSHYLGIA